MSEVKLALDSNKMVKEVTEARGDEEMVSWNEDVQLWRQEQEKQEQEMEELHRRNQEPEDESIKKIVEECLARSKDSAQGLESKLSEAQERIKYCEESLLNFKKESARMVQDLKDELEKKETSNVIYRKAMILMGTDIKSLKDGKGSLFAESKLELELKTLKREMEELVNKLKIVTGDKEYAEKSANNMENVIKTITKAQEAIKFKTKRQTKCREYSKSLSCSWGASCWFVHGEETQEGGMVKKSDCSFWLEGRCKFSDQDCRNTHHPEKKGSKSMVSNENSKAVFRISQDQSPPPEMVKQRRPAQGLEGEIGQQTVITQQSKNKTKVTPPGLGEQETSTPQLEDKNGWQTVMNKQNKKMMKLAAGSLGNQEPSAPQLEDENGWQTVRNQENMKKTNSRPSGLGEQKTSAPRLEDENVWQTVPSQQSMKKTEVTARRLGEQETSPPQLENKNGCWTAISQQSMKKTEVTARGLGEHNTSVPQLEVENGWQTATNQQSNMMAKPAARGLEEQEPHALQLEEQAILVTPTSPLNGVSVLDVQYSQEFLHLVPLLHSQYLLQIQQ